MSDLRGRSLFEILPLRGKQIPEYFSTAARFAIWKVISTRSSAWKNICWRFTLGANEVYPYQQMEFDRFMNENPEIITKLKQTRKTVLILESFNNNPFAELRAFFMTLESHIWKIPVIILREYNERYLEDLQIKAAADLGGLLIDGYGDGICVTNKNDSITFTDLKDLSFSILQASRMRISKPSLFRALGAGVLCSICTIQR